MSEPMNEEKLREIRARIQESGDPEQPLSHRLNLLDYIVQRDVPRLLAEVERLKRVLLDD